MKKYFSLAVVFVLLYATLLTAIPTSAAIAAGPYNSSDAKVTSCLKTVKINKTITMADGNATYYEVTVNSSEHGLNKNYKNHSMHVT